MQLAFRFHDDGREAFEALLNQGEAEAVTWVHLKSALPPSGSPLVQAPEKARIETYELSIDVKTKPPKPQKSPKAAKKDKSKKAVEHDEDDETLESRGSWIRHIEADSDEPRESPGQNDRWQRKRRALSDAAARFFAHARSNPRKLFFVPGLHKATSDLSVSDFAQAFALSPANAVLPKSWREEILRTRQIALPLPL